MQLDCLRPLTAIMLHLGHFLNKKLLLVLLLSFSYSQQQDITLELLQQLQDKIDTLEQSQGDCQTSIANANGRLATAINKEATDAANAFNAIDTLNGQVDTIGADLNSVNGRVNVLEAQVAELEAILAESVQRITKLENINAIWKANFKVVNSTFTVLRKKLQFVIPVLRLPLFVIPSSPPNPNTPPPQNVKKKKGKAG